MTETIYGKYADYLPLILEDFSQRIQEKNDLVKKETGYKLFEHLIARVKTQESMIEKCQRKGYEVSTESALRLIRDSIGLRIICGFVDDIYRLVDVIHSFDHCRVIEEKDYIKQAKPNGYRSYHMIVEVRTPYPDCLGNEQGSYFIEVQLRTIAMDSWASLEHQMKYKHDIKDPKRIVRELKRCADELASCDLTMQTIRNLIQESSQDEGE
ncbi:ppGpp synthetase catalytic domain-containing protein (RelA/SpoT-type nucleotidyltranferase) [Streptococcus equinus]|uniref:PpGpp synthetase catalytic domain-containing protein (RelA/SpoT-type nucleotidyltranferase) n=1 Tax=Streptococcus equinus TaxID=1335 RepID=A0A1H0KIR1_STREI|nr:GTP pyrophosphokinase [Streptococcus equinus]SDO55660.1 ppGpp synthetase catalytic domain-containing protein (RelA/SpoT-type nucleotidyltranferase) [Streptococcus equinus]